MFLDCLSSLLSSHLPYSFFSSQFFPFFFLSFFLLSPSSIPYSSGRGGAGAGTMWCSEKVSSSSPKQDGVGDPQAGGEASAAEAAQAGGGIYAYTFCEPRVDIYIYVDIN